MLFHLEPIGNAVTDLSFFGAVLAVMAVMLTRSGETQDRLISLLKTQASVDSLTGLVNRRVLDEALTAALAAPVAPQGTALVLVDVDSFKSINDQHGHPVGDDALTHIAGLLRTVVRAGDAVLSRMGGDELAVLLPDCPGDVALRRATEVLEAVRADAADAAGRRPAGPLGVTSVSRTPPPTPPAWRSSTPPPTRRSTPPSGPAAAGWRSRSRRTPTQGRGRTTERGLQHSAHRRGEGAGGEPAVGQAEGDDVVEHPLVVRRGPEDGVHQPRPAAGPATPSTSAAGAGRAAAAAPAGRPRPRRRRPPPPRRPARPESTA